MCRCVSLHAFECLRVPSSAIACQQWLSITTARLQVPADFFHAHYIRCPIPKMELGDDGSGLFSGSVSMMFTVSNDGETYRYTNRSFYFEGGCSGTLSRMLAGPTLTALSVLLVLGFPFLVILIAVGLGGCVYSCGGPLRGEKKVGEIRISPTELLISSVSPPDLPYGAPDLLRISP